MPRSRSTPAPITVLRFRSGRSTTATPPSGTGNGCWRCIGATFRHETAGVTIADTRIRDYETSDAENLNRIAVSAFAQFRDLYQDWPAMLTGLSKTSDLSASGEVIVVQFQNRFAGAV